jgi:dipeptidyl aminopeptidase/acylaminoacyl peptidase
MSARDVRDALLAVPVPDELEAQRRSWTVVREAYATREPVPRHGRRLRLLVALAVVAALVAAAVSPPGRSVGGWIRDRVAGEEATEPALTRLPSAGWLLVVSEQGPWIVRPDGSKRLLGNYEDASFSPNAFFVVATQGRRVVALEPDGDLRWTVTRPTPVADARWAPSPGYRVAYREGGTLRVVVGNGTGDRLLVQDVAQVPPAWLPKEGQTVLAYADTGGSIHVVEVDSGRQLWSADPGAEPEQLVWSDDARVLLVVTAGRRHPLYRADGRGAGRALETPQGQDVLDAAFAPGTRAIAYSAYDVASGHSSIVVGGERIQQGEGRLEDVVFSPNGRWLLTGWPEADQLLFMRLPGVSGYVVVPDVRREFDPGGVGATEFPRIVGWCCRQA